MREHLVVLISCLLTPGLIPPESPAHWNHLKQFARQHEIVGPHERWYSWEGEVQYVRTHYHALRNSPPLADIQRLPDIKHIENIREFLSRQEQCTLNRLRGCFPWEVTQLEYLLVQIIWKQQVYREMYCARTGSSWATQRRGLKRLRELVGEEDYSGSNWPLP